MSYRSILLKLLLTNALLTPQILRSEPHLLALTEALPPLNYEQDGKITGFATELLNMMAKESGIKIDKQLMPWERAYRIAQTEPNTLLYSLVRTPERDNQFQWVGPFSKRRIYLYKPSKRTDIHLKSLDDALAYRIGAVHGSAAMTSLLNAGFKAGENIDPALDDVRNMRKFKAQRFDLLLALDWAAMHNARQLDMKEKDLTAALLVDDRYEYWFGVSLMTDPDITRRLNAALQKIRKDGRLEKLTRHYLPPIPKNHNGM